MNAPTPASQRNRGVLKVALIVCACAFLFGFAMVPIYRIACEHVFGIKLAEGAASEAKVSAFVEDDSRTIRVQLVASVNSKLPWAFQPEAPIVGNAVPSIAPNTASLYFNKTECFCFTEQLLNPGESRRMPVRFVVDPKLPKEITELTLSYTFYENTVATQRVAETGSPLPAG
jgi:cytochrome c oxidase assembly protein subunit 11